MSPSVRAAPRARFRPDRSRRSEVGRVTVRPRHGRVVHGAPGRIDHGRGERDDLGRATRLPRDGRGRRLPVVVRRQVRAGGAGTNDPAPEYVDVGPRHLRDVRDPRSLRLVRPDHLRRARGRGCAGARVQHPDMERPYRTWGYPVVPIAYLALSAAVLWAALRLRPTESFLGLLAAVLFLAAAPGPVERPRKTRSAGLGPGR